MNDELIGGMRNALERGETIEQAIQAFLNAGYSPNEVREAAGRVAPSAAAAIYGQAPGLLPSSFPSAQTKATAHSSSPASSPATVAPSQPLSQTSSSPASSAVQPLPTTIPSPPHGKKTIVILIVVLLLLIVLLGITYLYSDKILGLLTG